MAIDVDGVVNNSMEVLGEELGVESKDFEQHVVATANGNITRLRKLVLIPLC
jgi:hypothetical protein